MLWLQSQRSYIHRIIWHSGSVGWKIHEITRSSCSLGSIHEITSILGWGTMEFYWRKQHCQPCWSSLARIGKRLVWTGSAKSTNESRHRMNFNCSCRNDSLRLIMKLQLRKHPWNRIQFAIVSLPMVLLLLVGALQCTYGQLKTTFWPGDFDSCGAFPTSIGASELDSSMCRFPWLPSKCPLMFWSAGGYLEMPLWKPHGLIPLVSFHRGLFKLSEPSSKGCENDYFGLQRSSTPGLDPRALRIDMYPPPPSCKLWSTSWLISPK